MSEAGCFGQVLIVQLKRRRDRWIEHDKLVAQYFNLAALEGIVGGAAWSRAHQALDLNTKLVAQSLGCLEHVGTVRVADHLHIAFPVAQVHKNDAAMVTPAVDPAAQGYLLAHQGFSHKTAIVGTHGHKLLFCKRI